jgi:hypothetical protein
MPLFAQPARNEVRPINTLTKRSLFTAAMKLTDQVQARADKSWVCLTRRGSAGVKAKKAAERIGGFEVMARREPRSQVY